MTTGKSRSAMTHNRLKRDDHSQSRTFLKVAREIGADEKKSESDKLLGRLAKMKPEPRVSGKKEKE